MKTWEELESLFKGPFLYAVFSEPRHKREDIPYKISARPIKIKDRLFIQNTLHYRDRVTHENKLPEEWQGIVFLQESYRQGLLQTNEANYQLLVSKKGVLKVLKKPATKDTLSLNHNLPKNYLLQEGEPISFLVSLGIMTPSGKVIAQKRDKFKQINRFLEMVQDVIPELADKETLEILDFGCGKSYLTFALYHYFENILQKKVRILGLDLKKEVIKNCQILADELGYKNLRFEIGDIGACAEMSPDLVVSLHACDTATDAALAKAVKWGVKVILAVPCCQHEFFSQIRNESLQPLLKHGILKERFAALATDAARAQLLEMQGYQVQILEFIDMEHTPKNLLIRAVKKGMQKDSESYENFKNALNFNSTLENLLIY